MTPRLIAVMGPTASGKSAAAEALATDLDALLVNADASQVYRGMDIGTAKPVDRSRYSLLDLITPDQGYGVGQWLRDAHAVLRTAFADQRTVIVVGGTGLYVRALFENYSDFDEAPDPALREELNERFALYGLRPLVQELLARDSARAARTDLQNPMRVQRALERVLRPSPARSPGLPPFTTEKFAIVPDASENVARINRRTLEMRHNGWIPEVQRLADQGFGPGDPGFRAHGYRALYRFLRGEVGLEEVMTQTSAEVVQYARRQRTWLRSEPNLTCYESGIALLRSVRKS